MFPVLYSRISKISKMTGLNRRPLWGRPFFRCCGGIGIRSQIDTELLASLQKMFIVAHDHFLVLSSDKCDISATIQGSCSSAPRGQGAWNLIERQEVDEGIKFQNKTPYRLTGTCVDSEQETSCDHIYWSSNSKSRVKQWNLLPQTSFASTHVYCKSTNWQIKKLNSTLTLKLKKTKLL